MRARASSGLLPVHQKELSRRERFSKGAIEALLMSEQRDLPRTLPSAIPALTAPMTPDSIAPSEQEARSRIAALEREARAHGRRRPPRRCCSTRWGCCGRSPLKHPRNAAVAYQSAFKLAPRFLANIRAARRLFAEVGNWVMVVQLIDAELAATDARAGPRRPAVREGPGARAAALPRGRRAGGHRRSASRSSPRT